MSKIIELVLLYKYLVIIPLAIVEGPIVAIITGFLVYLKEINIYISLIILVLADLIGDVILYFLGYFNYSKFHSIFKYINVKNEDVNILKDKFENHLAKTLIIGKLSHGIGAVVLISAGSFKIPFKKYFLYNFLASIPKSFALLTIGYFFGNSIEKISHYFDNLAVTFIVGSLIIIMIFIIYRKWNFKNLEITQNNL